jgi:hypothetical protein
MWRYVPANPKVHAIYTSASFGFAGSKALDEGAIRERCRIDDLPGLVAQAQAKQRRNSADAQRNAAEAQRNSMQRMSAGY